MKKTRVYLRIPAVADCGVGYYRQWLPMMTAKKKKEIDLVCQTFTWGEHNDESGQPSKDPTYAEYNKYGKWADILYYARNDVPAYLAEAAGLREYLHNDHKKDVPIILDIDDNVQATRPYNPGYRSFHPNSSCNSFNIKSLGIFDAITVSTNNLKEYYSDYTDSSKIYVCPNSFDWKERDAIYKNQKRLFSKSSIYPKKEGEIRIGWTGSASHWENLKHIEKSVLEILHEFPQTTFYFTGLYGDLFVDKELRDAGRIISCSWSGLKTWPKFNVEINFDIALAPLTDNLFNRAKSNLRVLEYSAAHYPVVCSEVEPYKEFKDKKEVLFATEPEEWYEAIKKLIKDKELCDKLAENLYQTAKDRYDIDKNYKLWLDCFEKVKK